jgi:PAS domain S-box-containing protein
VFRAIVIQGILQPSRSVKAVLLLSFMMIVMTVVAATTMLVDLRQRELTHAKGEVSGLSRILSDQTTRTFDEVTLTMHGVRERLSDKIGRGLDLDSVPVHLLLQARVGGLQQVKSAFLIDSNGVLVNSSLPQTNNKVAVGDQDYFRHFADGASDDVFISRPETSPTDGQPGYFASMRLQDADGRFRGVLVASIRINFFESLYDGVGPDMAGRILLESRDGALLAGKHQDGVAYGTVVGDAAALAELREARAQSVVLIDEAERGNKWHAAYRQVAKYPLVISVSIDDDNALASWRRIVLPVVGAELLILLMITATTFLIVRNLARKDQLETALRESDEQLRDMVQSIRDGIVTVNSGKRVVLFNRSAERMFGVTTEQAIGRELEELLSKCLPQVQLSILLRYLESGWASPAIPVPSGIIELVRNDQEFPVELSLSTTTFRGEVLLTLVFRDLSERRRAEHQLFETNRQLQQLSASLQNVREEERVRIARELHDELGQLLTGIRMELSWLGSRLSPDQPNLCSKITAIKGQIDQTIASVRRISSELRPSILDDLGFAAAAAWYVDQFSNRTGLKVSLVMSADDPEQGGEVATALFRVLQESLTNVARHAKATKVEVRLALRDNEWTLSIKDDGVGFVHDTRKQTGFGLVGMRERVQILSGRFCIKTAPGAGTLIEIALRAEEILEMQDEKI